MGGRTGSGDSSMSTPAAHVLTGAQSRRPHHPALGSLEAAERTRRWTCAEHSAQCLAHSENCESINRSCCCDPLTTVNKLYTDHQRTLSERTRLTLLMTCFNLRVLSLWAVWQADQLLFTISSACWCWVLASSPSSLHENNLNNQPAGFPGSWYLHLMFSNWFAILCATFSECESSEVAKTKPYIVYIKLAGNKNDSTLEMWCLGSDDHIKALQGRVGQDYCK